MAVLYVKEDIEPNYTKIPLRYAQVFDHLFKANDVSPVAAVKARFANDIKKGGYTATDQAIAEFLFKNTFATARQLEEYFEVKDKDKENFEKRLRYLVKDRFLNSFTLHQLPNQAGKFDDALVVYCLDFGGKYVLENFGDEYVGNWFSVVNQQSSKYIAKDLMTTQFYIDLIKTIKHNENKEGFLDRYISNPKYRISNSLFSINAQVDMKVNPAQERSLVLDVVYPGEEGSDFRSRIKNLSDLLYSKKWQHYFDLSQKPPMVLLVLPDFKNQIQRVMRTISHATEFKEGEFFIIDAEKLGNGYLDDPEKFTGVQWTVDEETGEPNCSIYNVTLDGFKDH